MSIIKSQNPEEQMYTNRAEAKMQMEVIYDGRNNEYTVAKDDKRCPFCDSRIDELGIVRLW
jgi:hypothetical protein